VATQIKSPVVLVCRTYRKLGLRELPTIPTSDAHGSLGQTLFDPPNVAGGPAAARGSRRPRCCSAATCFATCSSPTGGLPRARPPDAGIYARVGENLAKGMNITEATKDGTGDAESNQVDRDEDYNTRYASYRGYRWRSSARSRSRASAADFSLTR
jgi:hypothetical protein